MTILDQIKALMKFGRRSGHKWRIVCAMLVVALAVLGFSLQRIISRSLDNAMKSGGCYCGCCNQKSRKANCEDGGRYCGFATCSENVILKKRNVINEYMQKTIQDGTEINGGVFDKVYTEWAPSTRPTP